MKKLFATLGVMTVMASAAVAFTVFQGASSATTAMGPSWGAYYVSLSYHVHCAQQTGGGYRQTHYTTKSYYSQALNTATYLNNNTSGLCQGTLWGY